MSKTNIRRQGLLLPKGYAVMALENPFHSPQDEAGECPHCFRSFTEADQWLQRCGHCYGKIASPTAKNGGGGHKVKRND